MQRLHIHTPDWHNLGIRFGHLIHDPRFWASLALIILLGLIFLAAMLSDTTGHRPMTPYYPVSPYMP